MNFTTVFMFKLFYVSHRGVTYTGIVISSVDAVTLAILKPNFELILVREQTNRSNIIKQGRTPFIDFLGDRLMIVWDKFVEVLRIQAGGQDQPEYKITT